MYRSVAPVLLCLLASSAIFAQKDCSHDHLGNVPIVDLADGYFHGVRGGLYPGGSNERPAAHLAQCINNVSNIQPLDNYGSPDPSDGSVVMLGIGASNPMTEFQKFIEFSEGYEPVNDHLKIINACVGGQGIQKMYDVDDTYWNGVMNRLEDDGLTKEQVQVIWIEQDNTNAYDTSFPGAANALTSDFRTLLMVIHEIFPNVQICYVTARAYSGYAAPVDPDIAGGLLYPRDYYNGWALKFLIENVIENAPGYQTSGPAAQIPLVTWGSYHWTDGSTPREDGLFLDCETDLGPDGLHLSGVGEYKMGTQLFEFFKTDTTARYWYYDEAYSGITVQKNETLRVYPNPSTGGNIQLTVPENLRNNNSTWTILAMDGSALQSGWLAGDAVANISVDELPAGMYMLRVVNGALTGTGRFVRQ